MRQGRIPFVWILVSWICCTPLIVLSQSSSSSVFTLNLVWSQDVRGRMLPIDSFQDDCPPATPTAPQSSPSCYGGEARRATFIKQMKSNYTNVLAVDLGNLYYGTAFPQVANPIASNIGGWTSQSGYDIIGLGIDDFFNGPGELAGYLRALTPNLPAVVSSNLDCSHESQLSGISILPWVVNPINGTKVGVISAMPNWLSTASSPGANCIVDNGGTDDVTPLTAAVAALKTAHPDCHIIVLITGYQVAIAQSILANIPDIDVAIYTSSSSSDHFSATSTNLGQTQVYASIPLTGGLNSFGATMGWLSVGFDAAGFVDAASLTGEPVELSSIYPDDALLWAQVEATQTVVSALNSKVVGQMTVSLGENVVTRQDPLIWCRQTDCNLARFVTDAMLDWCKTCDFSHINSGSLRANLYDTRADFPNVTRGDIFNILPYGDNFVSYSIQGKDFLQSVATASIGSNYGGGGFQDYSNIRIAYNPSSKTVAYASVYDRSTKTWNEIVSTKVREREREKNLTACLTTNQTITPRSPIFSASSPVLCFPLFSNVLSRRCIK